MRIGYMISDSVILQVLAEQKDEVRSFDFSKWVSRMEESQFEFDSQLAQIVIGVRRSGKSTLCHKVLLEHHIAYAYVNLDDDRLANVKVEDLNTILTCIYQLYGAEIKYLFLDEIQNVDGWHLFVNRLLRIGMHIFVTGSNAKLLSGELATHLTGRYNEIRLYPFSFLEYCNSKHIPTNGITTKSEGGLRSAFMDFINNGGFPEMMNMRNKRGYVQSLINAILKKDIQQRFKIRNTDALEKTTYQLISAPCHNINFRSLSHNLNITDKTAKNYVSYLNQAFLIQLLYKFSYKSTERIRSQKAYLVDTGIQNNRDNSFAPKNIGWRLENVVYIELLRRCAEDFLDIYYYKASENGKEVDFVVCNQNKVEKLIQVAYEIDTPKAYKREVSALIEASKVLRCNKLSIITFDKSRTISIDGKDIAIVSAIDWLLHKL